MTSSTPDDVAADRIDRDEPPTPQFDDVVAYDADPNVVFCERENPTAWLSIDASAVESLAEWR